MSGKHDHDSFAHPVSIKLLFGVFGALIVLTILTVVTAGQPTLRPFGTYIAMAIASAKAFLVVAFFMHMWWEKGFNVVLFFSSFLFAGLLIGFTLLDSEHYQNAIELFPRE